MKKILGMDCSGITKKAKLAHDIFSFSYYCGGISFVDVANLTPYNIIDGRLIYERQKTHGTINLVLLDEAKAIIEQYTHKTTEQKREEHKDILSYLKRGYSVRNVAKLTNKGISTVQRIKTEFNL